MKQLIFALFMTLAVTHLYAQDTAPAKQPETIPEQLQLDQKLAGQIQQGTAKWLNSANGEFLSLFCPSLVSTKGSLLWLTAPNQTILEAGVMQKACHYFPTVGWQTLTITPSELDFSPPQMIAAESSAENSSGNDTSKSTSRLKLVDRVVWYEDQEKHNLKMLLLRLAPAEQALLAENDGYMLVAVGASAAIAIEAINTEQLSPVAVVLLNISHPNDPQQNKIIAQLAELKIPILDIYQVNTRESASRRSHILRQSNYKQVFIPAMSDDFLGVEMTVVSRIEDWLEDIK